MSTSPSFAPRITQWSFVVFDRGNWGREEVTVEEVRPHFGRGEPHWRIGHGVCLWDRTAGLFILPDGEEQWAAVKYATADEALAEAPRAAAHVLAEYADRLARYDAEHPAPTAPSPQLDLPLVPRTE